MPGTWHEPAAATPARVATVRGWRDLRPLDPALDALYRAAGIPVTARLAWWRAALMTDRDIVPLLLALRGPGGTLTAAALVALRDQDGECQITSVRPHTDDVWDVAAVSAGPAKAGAIASNNGNAIAAPPPRKNVRRGMAFLKIIMARASSSSEMVRS